MMDKLLKGYVLKQVIDAASKDARKYMKKRLKEFDADLALNKVGLARHRPVSAASGLSLLMLGVAVGAVAALAFAPKRGEELRSDLMKRFNKDEGANTTAANGTTRIDTSPIARV